MLKWCRFRPLSVIPLVRTLPVAMLKPASSHARDSTPEMRGFWDSSGQRPAKREGGKKNAPWSRCASLFDRLFPVWRRFLDETDQVHRQFPWGEWGVNHWQHDGTRGPWCRFHSMVQSFKCRAVKLCDRVGMLRNLLARLKHFWMPQLIWFLKSIWLIKSI